jgi:hypothetical protein
MKKTIVLFVFLFMCFVCFGQTDNQNQRRLTPAYEITLDFRTSAITPYGAIELSDGEILGINITRLPSENVEIVVNGLLQNKEKSVTVPDGDTSIDSYISIIHRSEMAAYQITVRNLAPDGVAHSWIIPVITAHWAVDFSGAFTVDALGNTSYYLEPAVRNNESGYFVRKNVNSSKLGLGTAAMVHLYFNKNNSKLKVIPITFGIGVSTGSDIRYYIGPSLRFGGAAYLTIGAVLGDVDRPPVSTPVNSFVTDPNALTNVSKKKKFQLFLGFSYSFINSNAQERLQQPFALNPVPQPGENGESPEQGSEMRTHSL